MGSMYFVARIGNRALEFECITNRGTYTVETTDKDYSNKRISLISRETLDVLIDYILVRKYTSPEPTPTLSQEQPVIATPLILTKTVSPWSIKQGQETTVSVTVENIGKTTIKDIEVKDFLSDDFDFITGQKSAKYDEIKPGESRTFQYIIKSKQAGKFNLPKATALYADASGNYHKFESGIPQVEVIASLVEETPASAVATPPATTPPTTANGETKEESPGFELVLAITGIISTLIIYRWRKNP
jgi:uncharacterized repeat protein (TIGR01451 family)